MVSQKERYLFIDGLRGIAASSVMLFHLYGAFKSFAPSSFTERIPWFFDGALNHGYLGVQVFFVISGFVMAHSLRRYPLDLRNFGVFALRRSVRLDPPYWIAIWTLLAINILGNQFFESRQVEVPSLLGVLANMFYLDNILGLVSVVPIGWTLCLEIQFYLVFFLLLWVARQPESERGTIIEGLSFSRERALYVFVPAMAFALCWPLGIFEENIHQGLWFPQWFMFLLGVFAYWSTTSRSSEKWLIVFLSINLALVVYYAIWTPEFVPVFAGGHGFGDAVPVLLATLITTSIIYAAGKLGRLEVWLSGPVLQFLGRISYSLYLMHVITGARLMRVLGRFGFDTVWGSLILVVIGLVGSLVGAYMLYYFVERPFLRLANYLRQRLVS